MFWKKRTKILLLFLAALFTSVILVFIGIKGKEKELYGDLDYIVSRRYGQYYEFVLRPPNPILENNKFVLSENDIVFSPGERIEGILNVKDGGLTYGLRFSLESDQCNYTVVFAVKGQASNDWSRVVIRIPEIP